MKKSLPLEVQSYRDMRTGNYYTVDKTLLIQEFLKQQAKFTIITRPGKFGKTINMSMMVDFFDITQDSAEIFEGTNIMDTSYAGLMNQVPVIYAVCKNYGGNGPDMMLENLYNDIQREMSRYRFLLKENRITSETRRALGEIYELLDAEDHRAVLMQRTLFWLSKALYEHFGKRPYLFMDEFDAPFMEAHIYGYYQKVQDILENAFCSALKENEYLERAVLTGVQCVEQKSIFSDMDNRLLACTVKDWEYAEYFGFTEQETSDLLEYYGLKLDDGIREMYGGYYTPIGRLFNPWSILKYADSGSMEPFWVNRRANRMLKNALSREDRSFLQGYEELIRRGAVTTWADIHCSFYEERSSSTLWGMMINSGYVTIGKIICRDKYELWVPNGDVRAVYKDVTARCLHVKRELLEKMFDALTSRKVMDFQKLYINFRKSMKSYRDYTNRKQENNYYMLLLGMSTYLYGRYEVGGAWESGRGRNDIILNSNSIRDPHIIMRLKFTCDEDESLETLAGTAVQELCECQYGYGFPGDIMYVGLAHCSNYVYVKYEMKKNIPLDRY